MLPERPQCRICANIHRVANSLGTPFSRFKANIQSANHMGATYRALDMVMLKFEVSIRKREKGDLSHFECSVVVCTKLV